MTDERRIGFLDGLRGIAILLVVGLHYFANIDGVPRSMFYKQHTPLQYGDIGVSLFFVISGYVIFLTLDKTPSFTRFIVRRWIRLFPAMLVASLLIAAAAAFIPLRPGGIPRLIDLVPGVTLLGANAISALTGIQTQGLERGFWSIYVEFRYYVIFGICYYVLGKYKAFATLVVASTAMFFMMQAVAGIDPAQAGRAQSLFGKMLIGYHLPWFLLGMHIYLYDFRRNFLLLLLIVCNALAYQADSLGSLLVGAAVPVLVYGAFNLRAVQAFCASRILLFFGFISYPLYLLNDSLGRGIIRGLYAQLGDRLPFELLPLMTLPFILLPSWYLAKYVEPACQRWLKQRLIARRQPGAVVAPPSGQG